MTTKVIITVPEPNHRPVDVVLIDTDAPNVPEGGKTTDREAERHRVLIGHSREVYIHQYRRLEVHEVPESDAGPSPTAGG